MLYSQTTMGKSVYYFVLGGYFYLDLSVTFEKLSSNLNEVTPQIRHSSFTRLYLSDATMINTLPS